MSKQRFDGKGMAVFFIIYPSLSLSGCSAKEKQERGKMLQLNSVSWLSSTTQNPMLWLPQSNSQSSQDSSAFNSISNSKTSNTKKKKKLSVKYQYYDHQQKSFTSSSRPSSSSAPPGYIFIFYIHISLLINSNHL
jgi:hypothetical protein